MDKVTDEQVEEAKKDLAARQARKKEQKKTVKQQEQDDEVATVGAELNPLDISILMVQRNTRINAVVAEVASIARDFGQSLEEVVADVDAVLEAVKPKEQDEKEQEE